MTIDWTNPGDDIPEARRVGWEDNQKQLELMYEIVRNLPKTKDGVTVIPHRSIVYFPSPYTIDVLGNQGMPWGFHNNDWHTMFPSTDSKWVLVSDCFSTPGRAMDFAWPKGVRP